MSVEFRRALQELKTQQDAGHQLALAGE